jgi:hypothetical protein
VSQDDEQTKIAHNINQREQQRQQYHMIRCQQEIVIIMTMVVVVKVVGHRQHIANLLAAQKHFKCQMFMVTSILLLLRVQVRQLL